MIFIFKIEARGVKNTVVKQVRGDKNAKTERYKIISSSCAKTE